MKSLSYCEIVKNREIAPNIYEIEILAKDIVSTAQPGQFVNVYCNRGELLLPRPISICNINGKAGTLKLVYGVVGKGTNAMAHMGEGEKIKVIGPLGKGFEIEEGIEKHIVIGGGIGVPPLLELVKHLTGKVEVYLGFTSYPILVEEFEKIRAKIFVATDNGSFGMKGNVIDLLNKNNVQGEMIYSCGPKPMLKAVNLWAKKRQIRAQLSLEERMACGIGACVGCTCKIKEKKEQDWQYKRVCKEGPVFWREEIVWE